MILDSVLPERIKSKIKTTINDCWEWQATKSHGYGMTRYNGKMRGVHRVVYELLVEKIPDGLDLDHLCRNPACVNPKHLEPVTRAENTKRGRLAKVAREKQLSKTFCPNGHPYNKVNTYITPSSKGRLCRTCRRFSNLKRYHERKLLNVN